MARPRAHNYEERRREILRAATERFARQGYDRTSLAEVAADLGVSKTLVYHYYSSKDALLYDIIKEHLSGLAETVEASEDRALEPREQLCRTILAILERYRDADTKHVVQINDSARLPGEQQAELKRLQRRVVAVVARQITAINPRLPAEHVNPLTMSLFGTLNWSYLWFRDSQPLSRADFAQLVTDLYIDGIVSFDVAGRRPGKRQG